LCKKKTHFFHFSSYSSSSRTNNITNENTVVGTNIVTNENTVVGTNIVTNQLAFPYSNNFAIPFAYDFTIVGAFYEKRERFQLWMFQLHRCHFG
jgi:hypothetical protein